jgi:hypothetical protein
MLRFGRADSSDLTCLEGLHRVADDYSPATGGAGGGAGIRSVRPQFAPDIVVVVVGVVRGEPRSGRRALVWGRGFADGGSGQAPPSGVAVAPAGAVYLVGHYSGSVDFDPGPGTEMHTSLADSGFVLNINAAGDFGWLRSFADGTCSDFLQ